MLPMDVPASQLAILAIFARLRFAPLLRTLGLFAKFSQFLDGSLLLPGADGDLLLEKALSAHNTSDLGTKHLDAKRIEQLVGLAGMRFRKGEAGQAVSRGPVVGALLVSRLVVAAAAASEDEERSIEEQDVYMSLPTLLPLAFAEGGLFAGILICGCWCWRRGLCQATGGLEPAWKAIFEQRMLTLADSTSGRSGGDGCGDGRLSACCGDGCTWQGIFGEQFYVSCKGKAF